MAILFDFRNAAGYQVQVSDDQIISQFEGERETLSVRRIRRIWSTKSTGTAVKGFFRRQRKNIITCSTLIEFRDGSQFTLCGQVGDVERLMRDFHAAVVHVASAHGASFESRILEERITTRSQMPMNLLEAGWRVGG